MADETETIDPAVAVEPEPAVAEPATPAAAEPAPSPSPSPAVSQPPKWALERIAEERRKGEEAVAAARQGREEAERRAAELEAIVQRMQAQPSDPAKPAAPATQPPPPRDPATGRFVSQDEPKDWNAAVSAEAERRLFIADCQVVGNVGGSEFTGRDGKQSWSDVLGVLQATGANSDDCLKDVIAVDKANAHKLLAHIAEDGDRAVRFAQMPSRQRIVELTKMSQTIEKPAAAAPVEPQKPAPTSKAPAPRPVLAPSSPAAELDPTNPDDDAKMTDAEWQRAFQSNPERFGKRLFGAR